MQTAPAPLKRRRWLRWGRVLLLGVILGALQMLLVLGWGWLAPWPFAWIAFIVLSLSCSLVISVLDGFLAARRHEYLLEDSPLAFLIGGIGFLIPVGTLWVGLLPLQPIVCPPGSCHDHGWGGAFGGVLLVFFLGALWLLEALLVGPLGGWLGGLLGKRSATAAGDASSKK